MNKLTTKLFTIIAVLGIILLINGCTSKVSKEERDATVFKDSKSATGSIFGDKAGESGKIFAGESGEKGNIFGEQEAKSGSIVTGEAVLD